ncbi:MAG: FAD-binding oxidoreductase [Pseudomonadota bacterium]
MNCEQELRRALGDSSVSVLDVDRWAYARDLSVRGIIRARGGAAFSRPLAVVWPRSSAQLQELVALARQHHLELVPYGAGSGVVGGLEAGSRTVVVDLKRFDALELDAGRGEAVAGAGVIGEQLERWLNERGFSLGHFPSSIYCSTVGGWVATRSAGQLSSRYGKIEDMVRWVEGVDGCGRVWRLNRGDRDLDALGLAVGSEGGLIILTRIGLSVHRLPSHRALRGADFPSVVQALDAMRQIMRAGLAPVILRLYDPLDTLLSGHSGGEADEAASAVERGVVGRAGLEQIRAPGLASAPGADDPSRSLLARLANALGIEESTADASRSALRRLAVLGSGAWPRLGGLLADRARRCRIVYGFEGSEDEVTAAEQAARSLVEACGGTDRGAGPGRHWLDRRYAVSYKMSRVLDAGLWVDTFEVAARWSRLLDVYHAVRHAVQGNALCLAHFSHAYVDGCSIYFSFVGGGDGVDEAVAQHAEAWRAGLWAARGAGAVLSHHHGIGRLKAEVLAGTEGPGSTLLRSTLKRCFDPDAVLNPGVLTSPSASLDADQQAQASPTLTGLRPLHGFELDMSSGLVRVPPQLALGELARRLARVDLELGARPAAFGDLTVQGALRLQDPRILARLTSIEARIQGQALSAPLAPRAATGSDLKAFVVGEEAPPVHLDRLWLAVRELVAPSAVSFDCGQPSRLAETASWLVEVGATAVELSVAAGRARLTLWVPGAGPGWAVWQARVELLKRRFGEVVSQDGDWAAAGPATGWCEPLLVFFDVDLAALLQRLLVRGPDSSARLQLAPRGGLVLSGCSAVEVEDIAARGRSGWAPLLGLAAQAGGGA